MNGFRFALGDLVVPKALLEVEKAAYKAERKLLFIEPARIVGRYYFESEVGVEEIYHLSSHRGIERYSVSDLAPAATLFSLWVDLRSGAAS